MTKNENIQNLWFYRRGSKTTWNQSSQNSWLTADFQLFMCNNLSVLFLFSVSIDQSLSKVKKYHKWNDNCVWQVKGNFAFHSIVFFCDSDGAKITMWNVSEKNVSLVIAWFWLILISTRKKRITECWLLCWILINETFFLYFFIKLWKFHFHSSRSLSASAASLMPAKLEKIESFTLRMIFWY